MNVLYSQLKKYLPDLKADAREVANVFTMTGFMIDKFLEVEYQGQKDFLLDLEVRQNRVDSFGVIGLARELSAYYDINLALPEKKSDWPSSSYTLPIQLTKDGSVKRVMSVKISDLTISESPKWLKEYLEFYGINSINNLVDITNYVMLETAFPSHAFDVDLIGSDKLVWERNPKYTKFITLAGDELDLAAVSEPPLLISNGESALSLSMIGGKEVAINSNTKNIILEIGVYDGGLVRRNSRQLKVLTEAGSRLEKSLDPDGIDFAFGMLVEMILQSCGGTISSQVYDERLDNTKSNAIKVRLDKISQIAGIGISSEESITFLKRLGFGVTQSDELGGENVVEVVRPINRTDIEQEEDIFEEVIRLHGFNKIPKDSPNSRTFKDVTPERLKLIDKIYSILPMIGYDEVRSWVLVSTEDNLKTSYIKSEEVSVTNSINEEVPEIRHAISANILNQIETYQKNNVSQVKIFEIGKFFGKSSGSLDKFISPDGGEISGFYEQYGLAVANIDEDINVLREDIQQLLNSLGFEQVIFSKLGDSHPYLKVPKTAHPLSAWSIEVTVNDEQRSVGIIYVTNREITLSACVGELNISLLNNLLEKTTGSVKEITQKIVILDANVVLRTGESIDSEVNRRISKDKAHVWSWEVVDEFEDKAGEIKYTIRIEYVDLSDQEAKELHERNFG